MLIDLGVLDDSLVLSKGANCMKITYKEVQGTLKRPMIGKTGLESPRKRTCTPSPSALEMRPSCFRYARAGQNNASCSRNVPHVRPSPKWMPSGLLCFFFPNGPLLGPIV